MDQRAVRLPRGNRKRSNLYKKQNNSASADADFDAAVPVDIPNDRSSDVTDDSFVVRSFFSLFPNALPSSVEPKVLVPFYTRRGQVPRRIQIERQRRVNESQSIEALLDVAHVKIEEILTAHLPLHEYDDVSFDARTREEWLDAARNDAGQFTFLPARAVRRIDDQYRYDLARVLTWDDSNRLGLAWGADGPTVVEATLPRVAVLLLGESPVVYARRVLSALSRRKSAIMSMRLAVVTDFMPTHGYPEIPAHLVEMVEELATRRTPAAPDDPSGPSDEQAQLVVKELKLTEKLKGQFHRTLSKLILQAGSDEDGSVAALLEGHLASGAEVLSEVPAISPFELLNPPEEEVRDMIVQLPGVNPTTYASLCRNLSFHTLMSGPVLAAVDAVRAICNDVHKIRLLSLEKTQTVSLDVFMAQQKAVIAEGAAALCGPWRQSLINEVSTHLKAIGKGWLNVNMTRVEIYKVSKLKRFFTMVHLRMEQALHDLIHNTIESFTKFIEVECAKDVNVISMSSVSNGGTTSTLHVPLFSIELQDVDNALSYSISADDLIAGVEGLVDAVLMACVEIGEIERAIVGGGPSSADLRGPMLTAVPPNSPEVLALKARIVKAMRKALQPLDDYKNSYHVFSDLIQTNKETFFEAYREEDHPVEDINSGVRAQLKLRRRLQATIPNFAPVGTFLVQTEGLRTSLAAKAYDLSQGVLEVLAKQAMTLSQTIRDKYQEIASKVNKKPSSVEVLYSIKSYIAQIPELTVDVLLQIEDVRGFYVLLENYMYPLSDEEFRFKWDALGWPHKLDTIIETVLPRLEAEGERFRGVMLVEQDTFLREIDKLQRQVASFSKATDASAAGEIAGQIKLLQSAIKQAQDKAADYNKKESLFGLAVTNYRTIMELSRELHPYAQLWIAANDWTNLHSAWHADPFDTLDAEEVDRTVLNTMRTMTQLAKTFREKPAMLTIVEKIRTSVTDFKPLVPVITALRNQGMNDRHWETISKELGKHIYPRETLCTLADVYTLVEHKHIIVRTCEVAAKEWQIESSLSSMRAAWDERQFNVEPYGESKTFVFRGTEEITALLDDHLAQTQQLSFSPWKAHFAEQIDKWEATLNTLSEVLEQLLEVQRQWLYLSPIFGAPDIAAQLPSLAKKFERVDRSWRKIMSVAHANGNPIAFTSASSKLLENLFDCNKTLESVQKGLNEYLSEKRVVFPRLFFLSDEELLEILGVGSDIDALQQQFRKVFEAVDHVTYEISETGVSSVTELVSSEGEVIPLVEPLAFEGPVEQSLIALEDAMKSAVLNIMHNCLSHYNHASRQQWVLKWPGQTVLTGSMAFWTAECEVAINRAGTQGLKQYLEVQTNQVQELVQLVQGSLTNDKRINIGALLTLEVHARDVVERMIEREVSSITSFDWTSQLRYYWEDGRCMVRQVETAFDYGCEYLGNEGRLVITPLTDRIYLTLTGAMSMFLGGAPAGPAGTGKTETVKDLAKAMAKQCVVFNCQEGLDFRAMAKFFKGLAMSGAWACFDEFNRINVEVLSVIAQQVSDLQQAASSGAYRIEFDGTDITVDPTFAVFITMNPGYAGRTELPDNLKVLFRPVACMVPDYAMIAEIRLFSFGYHNARELSRKMVATFRLASEQLSSQDHYDFGMRAVNTVIGAAGLMMRDYHSEKPNEKAKVALSPAETLVMESQMLLRALRDSNLPKFLAHDIDLFNGIVSDLFPQLSLPALETAVLENALVAACEAEKLQPAPAFLRKCVQLYEISVLRHGVMLVGPSCAGKSAVLKTLQSAVTNLAMLSSNQQTFETKRYGAKMKLHRCNPKALQMHQLYGSYDQSTHEWSDGVLATLFRRAAYDRTPNTKNWVCFDGPVDALWIESMNTVLDDNKKLCLVSGEIVAMSPDQTILFEVGDLAVASPATVSRCGMVYIDPVAVVPFVDRIEARISTLPFILRRFTPMIREFCTVVSIPLISWVRENAAELITTIDTALISSIFSILNALTRPHLPSLPTTDTRYDCLEIIAKFVPSALMLAVIWGVGGAIDSSHRGAFDAEFRRLSATVNPSLCGGSASVIDTAVLTETFAQEAREAYARRAGGGGGARKYESATASSALSFGGGGAADFDTVIRTALVFQLPPEGHDLTVYDWRLNDEAAWVDWQSLPSFTFEPSPQTKFSDLLVPTKEATRLAWWCETLIADNAPLLVVGPSGTGKTQVLQRKILHAMPEQFMAIFISFTAQTSVNELQSNLLGKLEKRRKDAYGAPVGKRFVCFIDDCSLPAKEGYGAQPPIELLRQMVDHGGLYRYTHPIRFLEIVDVTLCAAMAPPAARQSITPRFTRHFNTICVPEFDNKSLLYIFNTIMDVVVSSRGEALSPKVAQILPKIVASTVQLYRGVVSRFVPKPASVHYAFNNRDLSRVFYNLYYLDAATINTEAKLRRMWVHECAATFRARLITENHRTIYDELVTHTLTSQFNQQPAQLLLDNPAEGDEVDYSSFVFGDFIGGSRVYGEVNGISRLQSVMSDAIAEHNSQFPASPMTLSLFNDAILYVVRICRAIRMSGGHCMVLGLAGSGRRSLSRLAVFISEYENFNIDLTKNFGVPEWRDFLRRLLTATGIDEKPSSVIISDSQLVHPQFLEDISNLLSSGDVPNLFEGAELDSIYSTMRPICVAEGIGTAKAALYSRFTTNIQQNLHIILCFSPVGDAIRHRIRTFPALVSSTSIVWFDPWPREALQAVCQDTLVKSGVPIAGTSAETALVMGALCQMHMYVDALVERCRDETGRNVYITPASFLILLESFVQLLVENRDALRTQKARMLNGLTKLADTQITVKQLQQTLKDTQPILQQTRQEIEVMVTQINKDKEAADDARHVAMIEEAAMAQKQEERRDIRAEAQLHLDEALPELLESLKVLKNIKVKDIQEIAKYTNPPAGVKYVMEAMCVMKGVHPRLVGEAGKKARDYWEVSRQLLSNAQELVNFMLNYDRDNMPQSLIAKIRPYVTSENFKPSKVRDVSLPCMAMCQWVHAMYKYYHANEKVQPLREQLTSADADLKNSTAKLERSRAKLKEVEAHVKDLEHNFHIASRKQVDLQNQLVQSELKLDHAARLIEGLSSEKVRWEQEVQNIDAQEKNVLGDTLIAAGFVGYLGPLSSKYRQTALEDWKVWMEQLPIPASADPRITSTQTDPLTMLSWTLEGLPDDQISLENGIILSKASRWPLCIDPQGQAAQWIKNFEADNDLIVTRPTDKDFVQQIETAIRLGSPCLVEGVNEHLDPVLDPIFYRQIYAVGNAIMLKIGENSIPYDARFRLFLTCSLPNPKFPPEVFVKVSVLNFLITPSGLEEQVLSQLVARERKDLEDTKQQLVSSNAALRRELKDLQEMILGMLVDVEGDILDQEDLIEVLERSKSKSVEITEKVAVQQATEKDIDNSRNAYRPIAFRAATCYFCTLDLSVADPMYQYSLQWFLQLFRTALETAEKQSDFDKHLTSLCDHFVSMYFRNVSRSLLGAHKLLFVFHLTMSIRRSEGRVDQDLYRFVLAGPSTLVKKEIPNPAPWLMPSAWGAICWLSENLTAFEGFADHFAANVDEYRRRLWDPLDAQYAVYLPPFENLDDISRLCVLRCVRPDRVQAAVQDLVASSLGPEFIRPPPFDIAASFVESTQATPLLFTLSSGADPMEELIRFAEIRKMSKKLQSISLGQGQGARAAELVSEAMERGTWVLLQNCHLAESWMPTLAALVDKLSLETTKRDFRLWLTSMPSETFPVSVLQKSVKMTNEPPKGLRSNVLQSIHNMDDETMETSCVPMQFKKILFSMSVFHAFVQERRKFGSLGWNKFYEFTSSDLGVCVRQVFNFLETSCGSNAEAQNLAPAEQIPWESLLFLSAHVNYGGRITDDWDRRLILAMIERHLQPDILQEGYTFSSESPTYVQVEPMNKRQLQDVASQWPLDTHPNVFGLHANADLTASGNEAMAMLKTVLAMNAASGVSQPEADENEDAQVETTVTKSKEDVVKALVIDMKNSIPKPFDLRAIAEKFPSSYDDCFNSYVVQESARYSKLLEKMHHDMEKLVKALDGDIILSSELETCVSSIYINDVPEAWAAIAYPSLKRLASWTQDLCRRVAYLQEWIDKGAPPNVLWLGGLYFPQGFLTAILQNYARKHTLAVDSIAFEFHLMHPGTFDPQSRPECGYYMSGLFLEGARLDPDSLLLTESLPKELFVSVPTIWFKPSTEAVIHHPLDPPLPQNANGKYTYICPVYKTLQRAGTLMTTGHSTNFIIAIALHSDQPQDLWVKRGVAAFVALND